MNFLGWWGAGGTHPVGKRKSLPSGFLFICCPPLTFKWETTFHKEYKMQCVPEVLVGLFWCFMWMANRRNERERFAFMWRTSGEPRIFGWARFFWPINLFWLKRKLAENSSGRVFWFCCFCFSSPSPTWIKTPPFLPHTRATTLLQTGSGATLHSCHEPTSSNWWRPSVPLLFSPTCWQGGLMFEKRT